MTLSALLARMHSQRGPWALLIRMTAHTIPRIFIDIGPGREGMTGHAFARCFCLGAIPLVEAEMNLLVTALAALRCGLFKAPGLDIMAILANQRPKTRQVGGMSRRCKNPWDTGTWALSA